MSVNADGVTAPLNAQNVSFKTFFAARNIEIPWEFVFIVQTVINFTLKNFRQVTEAFAPIAA